jgi:hypothetical protein
MYLRENGYCAALCILKEEKELLSCFFGGTKTGTGPEKRTVFKPYRGKCLYYPS